MNFRDKAKLLWIKSMKTIGNTATNIANNTKFKVDEMTLQNRRRELAGDLSDTTYAMWLKGTEFPAELTKMLEELQSLDNKLNDMRAEKYAQGHGAQVLTEDDEASVASEDSDTVEEDESEEEPDDGMAPDNAVTGASPSLRSEIDGCFDHAASVDKMAEKVNSSLDQLTEKIRSFSPDTQDEK